MEDGTRKRVARRWTCWRSRSTSEPVATSRRRGRGAAVLDTAVPRPCVIGRASWRRRQQSRFARGKLDPRREPPLHVRASANPDLARADRLLGSRRFQHSELAVAAFVGFCIVAKRAARRGLLLWAPPAVSKPKASESPRYRWTTGAPAVKRPFPAANPSAASLPPLDLRESWVTVRSRWRGS